MLKTELKSYVSVIKGLAKNPTPFSKIAIRENTIQATDLTHIFTLKTEVKGFGVYDPKALDFYLLDNNATLSAFRDGELDDWVEFPEIKWGAEINLGTRHARRTLGEELIYALGFTSNDNSRPALMGVWSQKGEIVSTDGYRAYASGKMAELENLPFNLDQTMLKAYKKLAKYGNWTLTVGENNHQNPIIKLENENIVLVSKQVVAKMPEIRTLADGRRAYNYKVIIPFDKVKAIQDRENDNLEIKTDGSLTLNFRPLPFKAEIIKTNYAYDTDQVRQLIMGLSEKSNDTLACMSVRLAADFKTKNGELTLRVLIPEIPSVSRDLCYSVDDVL